MSIDLLRRKGTHGEMGICADVSALEVDIAQVVYSLYGITREEIAMIDDSLQQRAASREAANDSVREQET